MVCIIPRMSVYGFKFGSSPPSFPCSTANVPPARNISRTWVPNQSGTRGAACLSKYKLASGPRRQRSTKYSMRGCRTRIRSSPRYSGEASSKEQLAANVSCSWYFGETRRSTKLVARSCRHHHTSDHQPLSTMYGLCNRSVERLGPKTCQNIDPGVKSGSARLGAGCHSLYWSIAIVVF